MGVTLIISNCVRCYVEQHQSSCQGAGTDQPADHAQHGRMADTFDVAGWLRSRARLPDAVPVTQPKQVAVWTKQSARDGGGFLHGDASGLLTFEQPRLPADLNAGFPDRYTAKQEGAASPVDTIVQAANGAGVNWQSINVCTYRNNLNKVLLTPFDGRDGWAVDACLLGPTLFLDIVKAGGDLKSWPGMERMTYYGYKFEALCTGDGEDVDATSEFAIVVRYKLGRHRIVMAAEIDAAAPPGGFGEGAATGPGSSGGGGGGSSGGQAAAGGGGGGAAAAASSSGAEARPEYIELKCYKIPGHPKAEANIYSQKHPRWWVQSFLAGVQHLALGARDEQGTLRRVHIVAVQQLPELSARAGQRWDANMLLRFGDEVLAWMGEVAKGKGEGAQLRFTYSPERRAVAWAPVEGGGMAARLRPLLAAAAAAAAGGGGGGEAGAEAPGGEPGSGSKRQRTEAV